MNGPTFLDRLNVFQASSKHHLGTFDTNIALSNEILAVSRATEAEIWLLLRASPEGLEPAEADDRLSRLGPNLIAQEGRPSILRELWGRAKNPLNALLLSLAGISYFLGDIRAAVVISVIVLLAVVTAFIQEHRSNDAAAKLRAMVKTVASVKRRNGGQGAGEDRSNGFSDLPMEQLVPGDIVRLSAGDMIPADLRLLTAKDLFINQSALTGEAMPSEKSPEASDGSIADPFDAPNLCFMGGSVASGFGAGVIVHTGPKTCFGQLADRIAGRRELTSFDKGVNRFTWLMIRFMLVMVPAVFLINGFTKGDWLEALLFGVAVAVGLTPELLPMIVTVNLAKGAIAMSKKRVIVKRLNAIQNFGAMDVLCTDKTGTLTQDRIALKQHLDIRGEDSERVLEYAYLNSYYQSGLKNLLDVAVLQHVELGENLHLRHRYGIVDEIPFDFVRRRLSVVLAREGGGAIFERRWMARLLRRLSGVRSPEKGAHVLICKGAVEEVFSACKHYELDNKLGALDANHLAQAQTKTRALNEDGFRVVAVAYKEIINPKQSYSVNDETGLTLLGYIAFLDPPKESTGAAIAALNQSGVAVKILTGDNEIITRKICREVGLEVDRIALGPEIEKMSDAALADLAASVAVFAKVSPAQKARVIGALQSKGHVVGFLGDGINDSPALKVADVGVSVDAAVEIAKESADIILLEKSLLVLQEGVIEGRKVFGNIIKYIKMGASSNFGTMFSVLGASIFLPFLPMLPIQVLTNNMLYDFSQTAIPTDNVDADYLEIPRKWDIGNIFKFMVFIGPISSIFDYATFFTMLYVFNCWTNPTLFQTGWFVESLLTQTLIIHIIRTAKIPFLESRASAALIITTVIICGIAVALPFTPVGDALKFTPLPPLYWPIVASFLLSYATLTHLVKSWFVRRWGM
ncbi:HAD-IC family P-type ATPase (plasmid) [Methylocapsa polymorpha]|uniref:Magnesium-transporting ATPase, P-type 1 n=1 Tax=Methylocapsa polymorpha TaxID=3080828 RepID=A0ABZ0HX51_9HYPH|nr:HAD-IC family P-type ATPase [Methylocapsa sp. RX1]WOJ91813.1 HAD-IC family P-type ATPase [Methylocapsa sp. RX1]